MQKFTLYQVADYSQLDTELETGEMLVAGNPQPFTAMGGDRRWWTVGIETYTHPDCTIHLALVAQDGFQPSDLTDGSFSLDLQLSPEGDLLTMGWSSDGTPVTGQLVDRTPQGDRILLPWQVKTVATCLPQAKTPSYSAIHVCRCEPTSLPVLAVA